MEINLDAKTEEKLEKVENKKAKLDKFGRAYSTGKRKTSIARVWLKPGKGQVTVNKKTFTKYFGEAARMIVDQPLEVTDTLKKYDIICTVKGGGLSGQVQAIKLGISRALVVYNNEAYKSPLRKAGLLTRDARIVERKKCGRKKARKSFQFSKR